MAHPDLTSPLLPHSNPSHKSVLTVHDSAPPPQQDHYNHKHDSHKSIQINGTAPLDSPNPFEFLGSRTFSVPPKTTVDPFRNQTERIDGVYEVLKIVICLPLALARLVLFGAALLVGYLATKLALAGWKDMQNPMPKWRCRLMWFTRMCARCILFSFGYQWIRRKGKPAPREMAPIVVSNHVSYIEPIFYFYELFPTMVASDSHDSLPFVGTIIRAMQVIYVNRFSPSSRKYAVNEIKLFDTEIWFRGSEYRERLLAIDFLVCYFFLREPPQMGGSLSLFNSVHLFLVIQFNPLLFGIPMYILISLGEVLSRGNVSLAKLMFRMFTQFHNFMEVEYLPVVFPLENHKEIAPHYAKRTSHAIATALNVAQTSHSYGDLMLLTKASEAQQENPSSYMVEMAEVESIYHVSSLEAVDLLDKFLKMHPDSSGRVAFDGFLKVLRLRPSNLAEQIFRIIDADDVGKITFKQFLFGSAHVLKQPLFRQAMEQAFFECDAEGNYYFVENQFSDNIRNAVPEMSAEEIHELFGLFDGDGDGRVYKEEFLICLRKNPLLVALFSPSLQQILSSDDGETTPDEIV